MANLHDILNKNKGKAKDLKSSRVIVRAAMTDRPYDLKDDLVQDLSSDLNVTEFHKLETNIRQIEDKHKTSASIPDLLKEESAKKIVKNREKLKLRENKKTKQKEDTADSSIDFMQLTGLQKQITCYVFGLCKAKRDKITPPLAVEAIASACEINKMSIRKTIQRLEDKKVLFRHAYKEGRGGWTQYQLSELIYQQILQEEQWNVSTTKIPREAKNELVANAVNATIMVENNKQENSGLDEIDFSDLEKEIGFKREHLSQLIKLPGITSELLQNSIFHFVHDLRYNDIKSKIKSNAISYFMGIMRKQGVYSPPDNYEHPKDIALRQYLNKQRELEEKRKAMQKEVEDLAFNRWVNDLKEEEKEMLYSDDVKKIKIAGAKNAFLKNHFFVNVWPDVKTNYNPIS